MCVRGVSKDSHGWNSFHFISIFASRWLCISAFFVFVLSCAEVRRFLFFTCQLKPTNDGIKWNQNLLMSVAVSLVSIWDVWIVLDSLGSVLEEGRKGR